MWEDHISMKASLNVVFPLPLREGTQGKHYLEECFFLTSHPQKAISLGISTQVVGYIKAFPVGSLPKPKAVSLNYP